MVGGILLSTLVVALGTAHVFYRLGGHDHLFHSLLGLTAVETAERNPELDIFADCGRNG